jgi:hypothetical protein
MKKSAPSTERPVWKWPGLWAWLALDIVASTLFWKHFDFVRTTLVVNAAVGAGSLTLTYLRQDLLDGLRDLFTKMLRSRALALTMWIVAAALFGGGFLLTSIHVTAATPPNPPVALYRFEAPLGHPESALVVDSATLGRLREHGDFLLRPRSDREEWLVTAELRRTSPLALHGWGALQVVYPDEFRPMVAISLLPMEYFLAGVSRTRPLRIVVREAGAAGLTLAEDTIVDRSRMPGLILSVIRPPPADSDTRARWHGRILQLARTPADSASVDSIVAHWANFRWLRAKRDLNVGDSLEVVITRGDATVLHSQGVKVGAAVTDVIIGRT